MGIRVRDATGVLRTIVRVRVRDDTGVLRTIQRIRARDAAGVLRTVFTFLSASASPNYLTGAGSGPAYTGTVTTTGTTTATVSGGTAPYTYSWQLASGDPTIVPTSPTAATTAFTDTDTFDITGADYVCVVTDANGNTTQSNAVSVRLRWISTL